MTGWDKGLTVDVPTLAEVMGIYGYQTAAFTTDAPSGFRPDYGLDRGFQHMEITPPPRNSPDGRFRGVKKSRRRVKRLVPRPSGSLPRMSSPCS